MLIKTIEYIDYDGNPQKDTCYFNLSKAEIAAMQVRMDGKFIDHLQDLVKGKHIEEMFHYFRDLVLDSYGEKSADGKRFYKRKEARDDFEYSIAFSELLTELMQDPQKVRAFTRSILPPDFQDIEIPENPDELINSNGASVSSLPSVSGNV